MKTYTKRLLSALLSVVLVFSMVPLNVVNIMAGDDPPITITNSTVAEITSTDAKISATLSILKYVTTCGFYIGTSASPLTKGITETVNSDISKIWYNLYNDWQPLTPGTKYYYRIYAIIAGVEYSSAVDSFTTAPAFIITATPGSGCIVDKGHKFIYGLPVGTKSLQGFVDVASGYDLSYIPSSGSFGTGTIVNVKRDGIIVESYKIIIFGDVNGDGNIDSLDAGIIVDIENHAINWDPITNAAFFEAGDLNGDGNIDSTDAGIVVDIENSKVYINQSTGLSYTSRIIFNSAGGSLVAALNGNIGAALAGPASPTKTGYTFAGWLPALPAAFPVGGLTVIAQWTAIPNPTSTITFNLAGGTPAIADIIQDEGTAVTAPAAPTKAGFTFNGWVPAVPSTMPVDNVTCVAQWTAIPNPTSTITFNLAGGTPAIADIIQDEGTAVTAPTAPTKAGFTFNGWIPTVPSTMPVDNVTCVAQWTAILNPTSTITFDVAGGTPAIAPITQDEGTAVTAPAAPTKAGFTFNGWVPLVPATMPVDNVTCVAQWTAIPVMSTITFNTAGGTAVADKTGEVGTIVPAVTEPTKVGNTFAGWSPALPTTFPVGGLSVTASWKPISYTITFDANGGIGGIAPSVEYGTTPIAPTVTREGYTFDSWSTAVVPVTGAATYTAKWTINTYTITWGANGGTGGGTNLCDHDAMPTPLSAGTKANYHFTGWDSTIEVATGDKTYTAQWAANSYKITFNANNGTGSMDQQSIDFDATAALAANTFTRIGYIFAGWNTLANGTGTAFAAGAEYKMVTEGATLYAQWTVTATSTITFDSAGGSAVASLTGNVGSELNAPVVPTKEGYTFKGWIPALPGTFPEVGFGVTAVWKTNSYTITFDSAGGSAVAPITQNFGTDVTTPTVPTKVGHTFEGWEPEVPSIMPLANTNCVAKWSIISYTITFDANGGIGGTTPLVAYGTMPTAPTVTQEGFTFDGWEPTIVAVIGATTYRAKWTAIAKTTITFDSAGGSTVNALIGYVGATVPTPTEPTKTGYTFLGWDPALPPTFPAVGFEVTAVWKTNSYTITFDSAGGSTVASITQNYATSVATPASPTKTGYTFAGWSPIVPTTMPATATTCVAQWTINQYSITFDSAGGSAVTTITQNYDTAITLPTSPTMTGYTFTAWLPVVPSTMPATATTCVAQWDINYYTITFDANGGIGGTTPSVVYGGTPTAPVVTREGYVFGGWDKTIVTATQDKTYTAQWTINQYSITFDSVGGTAISTITQNYGTALATPAPPIKVGYTFAGWQPVVPSTMPATATNCVAQWTAIPYVTGNIIEYGSYPQSKVTSSTLISALNSQTLQADSTVTYDGSKYKRLYFTTSTNTDQATNGYKINTVYWFKFEPLQWRVLSNTNGELFVIANKILDSKAYNQVQKSVTWETCTMRNWLNNDFYSMAFNATEREKIKTSTVVNADNPNWGTDGGNNTSDKLFLLSYSEAMNSANGFSSDTARRAQGTDFSKSNGLEVSTNSSYLGNSRWRLRTPGVSSSYASSVDFDGGIGNWNFVNNTSIGVRPAFKISL